MKRLASLIAAMCLWATAGSAHATDDSAFDALLSRYVVVSSDGINRVNYRAWKASAEDMRALDAYIAQMQRERPSAMRRDEAFAYWANLYNAVTLQVVLQNYPVNSIRDIRSRTLDPRGLVGPWRTKIVAVEGRRMSLDDIEHGTLRPQFGDPRVHYAVNCASIGCPNLQPRAWRAQTLNADLDAAARAYVNHPRGVSISANGDVRASSIFDWFKSDFGGADAGVLAHVRRYADPALTRRLQNASAIRSYGYDWALNDASR